MVLISKIRPKHGPEFKIQKDIIAYLLEREWFVRATHGNQYQSGYPDLFAAKRRYGPRWIEVKNTENFRFTDAQMEVFPQFSKNGVGIWDLQGADHRDYARLFGAPNWASFLPVSRVYTRTRHKKPKELIEHRKAGSGPERIIQDKVIEALETAGWFVLETHGSLFQCGFPDLYAVKKGSGQRWIEIKNPDGYTFTGAQLETFPRMMAEGIGIWILTSEQQLDRLDGRPNWMEYLK